MDDDWQTIETAPKPSEARQQWGNAFFWLYCRMDGVVIGHQGLAGEWWLTSGERAWAPSHWKPYRPPEPPKESLHGRWGLQGLPRV